MNTNLKNASEPARRRRQARQELKLRHILVPLDFSGQSRQALACAVPLARAQGAKISLVHVVQPAAAMGTLPDGNAFIAVNAGGLVTQAEAHLSDLAVELLPAEVRGQTLVREGNAAYEIIAAAEERKADLIALSTHGHSGLARVMLGSTAEAVVRHAHCPVLTVRRQPGASAMRVLSEQKAVYPERLPWRRVLVPLDFSLTSLRALDVAVPLARASGALCYLLHVIETVSQTAGMDGAMLAVPMPVSGQTAQDGLSRVKQRFVPATLDAPLLVGLGGAANVILETAAEREIDLIVLSTHRRTGLKRMLLGSTAEQVVRHARCPIFVARRRPDREAPLARC